MKRILVAALLTWSTSALAAPKPSLSGSFEIVAAKGKKAPEQAFGPMLVKAIPDAVWGRIYFTFEGAELTIGSTMLERTKDGVFSGCGASAKTQAKWTAKGFTVASKVVARSEHTTFKTLTPNDDDHATDSCNASLDAGTLLVGKDGARVTLTSPNGVVLFLMPIDDAEKPDWGKHLPAKK
jgi:hypothetical protein